MRIVRYRHGDLIEYGIVEGDAVYSVAGDVFGAFGRGVRRAGLDEVRLLAPCEPSKVVALGLNYAAHAAEMKVALPTEPLIFLKPSTSVTAPDEPILYPAMSEQVEYECELAVVIGRKARQVAEADAAGYVLGYTCANDVTARDLQRRDSQWSRAKGFDTFCPLGPWIETEIDPGDLHIETRVNGVVKQSSRTSDLVFRVPRTVSYVSQIMTLLPGDVILTGTPSGVGPVQPGDVMEVEIEGIGVLRNPVEDGR